jgi:hypothetical protein
MITGLPADAGYSFRGDIFANNEKASQPTRIPYRKISEWHEVLRL